MARKWDFTELEDYKIELKEAKKKPHRLLGTPEDVKARQAKLEEDERQQVKTKMPKFRSSLMSDGQLAAQERAAQELAAKEAEKADALAEKSKAVAEPPPVTPDQAAAKNPEAKSEPDAKIEKKAAGSGKLSNTVLQQGLLNNGSTISPPKSNSIGSFFKNKWLRWSGVGVLGLLSIGAAVKYARSANVTAERYNEAKTAETTNASTESGKNGKNPLPPKPSFAANWVYETTKSIAENASNQDRPVIETTERLNELDKHLSSIRDMYNNTLALPHDLAENLRSLVVDRRLSDANYEKFIVTLPDDFEYGVGGFKHAVKKDDYGSKQDFLTFLSVLSDTTGDRVDVVDIEPLLRSWAQIYDSAPKSHTAKLADRASKSQGVARTP